MVHIIGAIDEQTRCKHYHGETDRMAIKFKCCDTYYCCYYCHEEASNHRSQVWQLADWQVKAVCCGACSTELTIEVYLTSGYSCPNCKAAFNPRCSLHYHLYFEEALSAKYINEHEQQSCKVNKV